MLPEEGAAQGPLCCWEVSWSFPQIPCKLLIVGRKEALCCSCLGRAWAFSWNSLFLWPSAHTFSHHSPQGPATALDVPLDPWQPRARGKLSF